MTTIQAGAQTEPFATFSQKGATVLLTLCQMLTDFQKSFSIAHSAKTLYWSHQYRFHHLKGVATWNIWQPFQLTAANGTFFVPSCTSIRVRPTLVSVSADTHFSITNISIHVSRWQCGRGMANVQTYLVESHASGAPLSSWRTAQLIVIWSVSPAFSVL